ncbi:MAG: hypothetical protein HW380_3724 [Magnetococcales bacterium]|nr:hypothetical protein [Magnetococcales bacterium]
MLGSNPPRDKSAGLIEPIARDGGNPLVPNHPSNMMPCGHKVKIKTLGRCPKPRRGG